MERLPGFRDFYPDPPPQPDLWSADARRYLFEKWRAVARRYGFREYDGPPLEALELFTAKSGGEIIGQLYNFKDKGERDVALRPEMTPTLARMVAAHERSYKKPIKWFTIPQLFRYERPQKGRLREHFQLNVDIIGESAIAAEAELIALLIDTLRVLGLTEQDLVIRLSSRKAWQDFFQARGGKPEEEYDFYQIIDKLDREDPLRNEQKLRALGLDLVEVKAMIDEGKPTSDLQLILDNLAARTLDQYVRVDYGVVRGLAYYTGIVFEAFDRKGEFRAIAGGGRYDNLVKLVSGGKVNLPALGFGMGDVVILELLKARLLLPKFDSGLDAFCLIEDEDLRPASLKIVQDLRWAGFSVDYSLTPAKPDKQFRRALELQPANTIKLEHTSDGTLAVKLRSLKTKEEKTLPPAELTAELRRG
jgi:histidyl-tRNA synthetase